MLKEKARKQQNSAGTRMDSTRQRTPEMARLTDEAAAVGLLKADSS